MLATAPALMSTSEIIFWSACVGAGALVVLLVDQQGPVALLRSVRASQLGEKLAWGWV